VRAVERGQERNALTLALQLVAVYWTPMGGLLGIEPLGLLELTVTLLASTGVLWAVEAEKATRRRRANRR